MTRLKTRICQRLLFLFAAALFCSPARAESGVPLLDDASFTRGFMVTPPDVPPKAAVAAIQPGTDSAKPAWSLAQWYSRFNLADDKPNTLPGGAIQFFDGAKSVTFFPSSGEADLALALNGMTEYRGLTPSPGAAWPHLLLERPVLTRPSVGEMNALRFALRYRLSRVETHQPPGYDRMRHTAQFTFYLTVNDLNPKSPRHGDYFWFGVPLYDARHRLTPDYINADFSTAEKEGTGKLIYSPAMENYTTTSAHDGQWVTIDADLLPLIRKGLQCAWDRGFLKGSHDAADYHLVSMNMGWEVTGPVDVEMQIKGLKLEAVLRQ